MAENSSPPEFSGRASQSGLEVPMADWNLHAVGFRMTLNLHRGRGTLGETKVLAPKFGSGYLVRIPTTGQ